MTQRATGDAWTRTLALAMAGTEGTAVRGRLEAQGGMGEAAAQGRVSPLRVGALLDQIGGVLLEGVGMEEEVMGVEGAVEEEEGGGIKDKTAPLVFVTTVALVTPP